MGYNIAAYVEHKNKDTNKWELVCKKPVSCYLKYIFDDYQEYFEKTYHNQLPKIMKEIDSIDSLNEPDYDVPEKKEEQQRYTIHIPSLTW